MELFFRGRTWISFPCMDRRRRTASAVAGRIGSDRTSTAHRTSICGIYSDSYTGRLDEDFRESGWKIYFDEQYFHGASEIARKSDLLHHESILRRTGWKQSGHPRIACLFIWPHSRKVSQCQGDCEKSPHTKCLCNCRREDGVGIYKESRS